MSSASSATSARTVTPWSVTDRKPPETDATSGSPLPV